MGQMHGRSLREAVEKNSLADVHAILDAHPNCLNETDQGGNTAVMIAAKCGHATTLRELIRWKADLNTVNSDNETALHFAARLQHNDCVKLLLQSGATPNAVGQSPLVVAFHHGNVDVFSSLYEHSSSQANLNCRFLVKAVDKCDCDKIEFLVNSGENANDMDGQRTALMAALNKWTQRMPWNNWKKAPKIQKALKELEQVKLGHYTYLAIALYLIDDCKADMKLEDAVGSDATNYFYRRLTDIWSPMEQRSAIMLFERRRLPFRHFDGTLVCKLCCDNIINIKFHPCGHRVACEACCRSVKRCLTCNRIVNIRKRCDPNGDEFDHVSAKDSDRQLNGSPSNPIECDLCMEKQRDVSFIPCGHGSCRTCADKLPHCHLCRSKIEQKLITYF